MTTQQRDFMVELGTKVNIDSQFDNAMKIMKKMIKETPTTISKIPPQYRNVELCKVLIKNIEGGYDMAKRFIPKHVQIVLESENN